MAVFSTNQVRHLYVAENTTGKQSIVVKTTPNGDIYFMYTNNQGDKLRSDIIDPKTVEYVHILTADEDIVPKNTRILALKDGDIVSNQDYLLRIVINPFVGMSDEEPYIKYGVVHATADMTKADFMAAMKKSLDQNFSREIDPMLEFSVDEDNQLVITEKEQEYVRGIKSQERVFFEIYTSYITKDGADYKWGKITTPTFTKTETPVKNYYNNGRRMADLEYFCMGERGDQYRNIGWPNSIPTKYLVDPDAAYNVLEIHYAYVGPNEGPQRSEKDITIVCANKANLNKLIGQFATASGVDIAELV